MTLLWIEGFEGFGTSGNPVGLTEKYSSVSGLTNMNMVAGRIDGSAIRMGFNAFFLTPAFSNPSTVVIGFGFKTEILNNRNMVSIREPSDVLGVNVQLTTAGELLVKRGGTTLASTSSIINTGTWYFIELKVVISNTGSFELRVNEETKLSQSADTQAGSTAAMEKVTIVGSNDNVNRYIFDDIYILDNAGSVNNDFLGNSKVFSLDPNAIGDSSQWTSTEANNFEAVDEAEFDGDTTHNEDSVTGERDLYNLTSSPTAFGTVHGMQINTTTRVTDATTFTLITPLKTGGTVFTDAGIGITSTDYLTVTRIQEQNPNTSAAWSKTELDALQVGVEVG